MKPYYSRSVLDVVKELNTDVQVGLSEEEAKSRLAKNGENKIETSKKSNGFLKFLSQFKDIMVLILICAAIISLIFAVVQKSSSELIDAIIIFVIVLINATLGFLQEIKAENALETLKKMAQPFSTVLRDGEEKKVKTKDLVVGDIVVLEAGDVVPADLLLIESASLKCEEASLTGESLAVEKISGDILPEKTALGDRKNMCFSSTTVVYGRGVGIVVATGKDAEIGKIASMLSQEKKETTPLQKSLNKLGEIITFIVLGIAIVIFLCDILVTKQNWIDSFLTAVAIAVAAIPESLPAVVTIILSIGVTRLAKKNTIIRKLHAVETLGCCQVICSDKTGTITQNKMVVKEVYCNKNFVDDLQNKTPTSAETLDLLKCMTLCNDAKKQKTAYLGDPTEVALIQFAETFEIKKRSLEQQNKRVAEIPFDSNRKLMTTVNQGEDAIVQYTKGGVDEVLAICEYIFEDGKVRKLTLNDIDNIKKQNNEMCKKALRVLAYAKKELKTKGEMLEGGLIFLGLTGMIDPPRDEVYDALIKCKQAGMKAVMITGDHKETATAIAKELKMIKSESEVVNGSYLDKFTDEELVKEITKYSVFTRVTPEHKVRIVKALQANGKVVAMTGDGVNDAPSIKSANIGIGMGITGTEVTKEVADMILTDDNFATIVLAVEEGRKIFSNIKKTISLLLSCNIAEVLTIFFVTIFFPKYTFFSAVQILFINLVTDTFPAIALSVNEADIDTMKKPPRDPNKNILSGRTGVNIIYQGIAQTLLVIATYLIGFYVYASHEVAVTMCFITLNAIQLFHMYNVKSDYNLFKANPFSNKMVNIAFVSEIALLILVGIIPPVASLFGMVQISVVQWLISIGFAFVMIPICEIWKFCDYKISKTKNIEELEK